MNAVQQLQLNQFLRLTYQEKLQVNTLRLHQRDLQNIQNIKDPITEILKQVVLQNEVAMWLSYKKNALFCFPCLLSEHRWDDRLETSEWESEKAWPLVKALDRGMPLELLGAAEHRTQQPKEAYHTEIL